MNNGLLTYPPLGSLVKQPPFPNTLPNKDLACGRRHGVYPIGQPVKSGTLSICRGRNLIISTSRSFLKYKCKRNLKQPLTPPKRKIVVAYHISNQRLGIETRLWSTIPIFRDIRLCRFCLYDVVEK